MNEAAYSIEKQDRFTRVSIHENKFTARVAPEMKAEITALKAKGVKNIIFDMEKAAYCDSSGLSVILVANRVCKENNGCLVVSNLQPSVKKLILISQLDSVLNITPTYDEAVDFIFMDELEKGLSDSEENLN